MLCSLKLYTQEDSGKKLIWSTASLAVIILNVSIKSPLILLSSSIVHPSYTNRSSFGSWQESMYHPRCCTFTKHSVSFFKWGDHAWTQYSIRGRIYNLYMSRKSSLSSLVKFLLTIPITDLALAADWAHCVLDFKSSVTCTPRSLSSTVYSVAMLFPASSCRWYNVRGPFPMCITLHLLAFSFRSYLSDHLVSLWRSSWRLRLSTSIPDLYIISKHSHAILDPLWHVVYERQRSTGPRAEPCSTPLCTFLSSQKNYLLSQLSSFLFQESFRSILARDALDCAIALYWESSLLSCVRCRLVALHYLDIVEWVDRWWFDM